MPRRDVRNGVRGGVLDYLDPVEVMAQRLLETPQVRDILGQLQDLLDRVGYAIDRHPPPPAPRARPRVRPRRPPPPRTERRVPATEARSVLHFDPAEALTVEKVQKRRRALAALCHPDQAGGSTEAMQTINAAADVILRSLSGKKP